MQLPGGLGPWNGETSLPGAPPDIDTSQSQTIQFRSLTVIAGFVAALPAILGVLGMLFGITILSSVYTGYRILALRSGPGTPLEFRFLVNRRYGE